MTAWHEDDTFWETFAPALFGEKVWARTPTDIDGVLALAEACPGARVLDLCCGPGRHSLELARRGFAVTGVDRTAAYLEQAREAANAEGLAIEFVQADAREYSRPAAFDLVTNLYTSFGYFDDPADDGKVARNIAQSLRPGGRLVMELMGKEVLARIFQPRGWSRRDDVIMLEERELCNDWSWIRNRWTLIQNGKMVERELAHRIYSAAELKALLRDSGFAEVRAYGSLTGDPYDHVADKLVVVGSTSQA